MADAVDLYVDLAELGRVRTELRALLSSLTELSTRRGSPVDAESMGSDDVADAVERFRHRWADAGERMAANLRACLDYADLAVEQYGRTEDTLCDQLGDAPVASGTGRS
jgi:hypothetical protein